MGICANCAAVSPGCCVVAVVTEGKPDCVARSVKNVLYAASMNSGGNTLCSVIPPV